MSDLLPFSTESLTVKQRLSDNESLAIYFCSDRVQNKRSQHPKYRETSYLYGNYPHNSMTYAIIETSGTQLRVEPGRFYDINRLPVEPEGTITIDRVLLVKHEEDIHIGQPLVEGATIEATVLQHMRGRKVIVYKMQPKKKTRKKRGHRQELTRLMINSISLNGSVLAAADLASESPEAVEAVEAVEVEVAAS
jgi:large subunit ribosomal protein L21